MSKILDFPAQPAAVSCRTCGGPIILTQGETLRDQCFCCQHTIPLPLGRICRSCEGNGWILTHARSDDDMPKRETCMDCLGTGRK